MKISKTPNNFYTIIKMLNKTNMMITILKKWLNWIPKISKNNILKTKNFTILLNLTL